MGTRDNAQAAFDDETICPPGFETIDLDISCKTYTYEPDFFLYFYKSQYLISITTNNDFLKDTLQKYAVSIEHTIP